MDPPDATDLIEIYTDTISTLTTALTPLLNTPLPQQTSHLPLLSRAKLYTLYTYTIESLLFSALTASGIDAKSHPIYPELARLKSYFQKIQDAEHGHEKAPIRLDKGAAGRFIKAALSGNEQYDKERAERVAREKARASIKARRLNKKFDDEGNEIKQGPAHTQVSEAIPALQKRGADEPLDVESQALDPAPAQQLPQKRKADDVEDHRTSSPDLDLETENAELYGSSPAVANPIPPTPPSHKKHRKQKPSAEQRTAKKATRRTQRDARKAKRVRGDGKPEEYIPASDEHAPRTHSETFTALLNGPLPKREKKKTDRGKSRRERKGKEGEKEA